MILSGKEIQRRLGDDIHIDPFVADRLNPNSYNLRLHHELLIYKSALLDMKRENAYHRVTIPDGGLVLEPGELYLGRTIETTRADRCVPMLEGRSSVGRLGITIHITAGLGHVGANGYWTLEIACVKPVRIYAGVEICQIYFAEMRGEYTPYNSLKYHNNNGVQPSLLYTEFQR
ncbi:MAG: dCTP deaminase [Catalinimonas sp.]